MFNARQGDADAKLSHTFRSIQRAPTHRADEHWAHAAQRSNAQSRYRLYKTAAAEGLARAQLTDVVQQVQEAMWQPVYPELVISPQPQGTRQEARV